MHDQEASLTTVAFDAEGRDLDLLDGLQQLRRAAAISKGAHGVLPADGVLQLCGSSGRGGIFLFSTVGDALPRAPTFRFRPPRGRLCWSSSQLVPGSYTMRPSRSDGLHGIQVAAQVHDRHSNGILIQSPK
jgi:hypothetical protein